MNDKVFFVCVEINKRELCKQFEHTVIGKNMPKKIIDNVYAVVAPFNNDSEMIRDQINKIFNGNCNVFIMKASFDASWRLNIDIDQWLRNNI